MQQIIPAVPRELIEKELNKDTFLRFSNFGNKELYSVSFHDSPNTMREIGRLREITFRNAGGGTGKEMDIDEYDTAENPYRQLIVWDSEVKEILGGYRYILCKNAPIDKNGNVKLATSGLLKYSEKFVREYLPSVIELGRSFVRSDYQSTSNERKNLFVLDNLWDGLGALIVKNPDIHYLFGKVTMYTSYNQKARDFILYFLKTFFPDKDKLITPYNPLGLHSDEAELKAVFTGLNYAENYKILSAKVREYGENIPPLINSYMNLSSTMMTFGTSLNKTFGDVEETGILVNINDMLPSKTERHIETYKKELLSRKY
ncbi:MAG: hemolysin [Bacteroidetes bacterium GWF2_33_38]|nr:MAG: hemolysin [Bacteroidetes bacterium GWF2_33_38]